MRLTAPSTIPKISPVTTFISIICARSAEGAFSDTLKTTMSILPRCQAANNRVVMIYAASLPPYLFSIKFHAYPRKISSSNTGVRITEYTSEVTESSDISPVMNGYETVRATVTAEAAI